MLIESMSIVVLLGKTHKSGQEILGRVKKMVFNKVCRVSSFKISVIGIMALLLLLANIPVVVGLPEDAKFCDIWNLEGKCSIHSGILFNKMITGWSNNYTGPETNEFQRAARFLDQQGINNINIVAHVSGGRWWDSQIKEFLESIDITGVNLKVVLDLEPDSTWSQQNVLDNIDETINIAKKEDNTLYSSVVGISLDMEWLGGTGRGTDTLNKIREKVVVNNPSLKFFPIWFNEVSRQDLNGMSNKANVIPLYDGLVKKDTSIERDGSNNYINNMVISMKNNGFTSVGVMPISDSPIGSSLKDRQSTAYKTWFIYKEAVKNAGGVDYFFLGSGNSGEDPLSIYLLLGTPVNYPVIDDNPADSLHWDVPYNGFGNWYAAMNGYHSGEDWNLVGGEDLNEPVYAIADGKVVKVSDLGSLGHLVAIEHNARPGRMYIIPGRDEETYSYETEYVTKIYSVYVHITPADGIIQGAEVKKGETVIGYIMNPTGGPHLHFEIRHPNAKNSLDWSLVGSQANWAYSGGNPNGYYKNLQQMVDAGVRDPRDFIKANSIFAGVQYLRTTQNPDGSWSGTFGNNVGYVALGALTFLNHGIPESDPIVSKAIDYIRSNRKPDGSIFVSYSNYETSIAILPLVATHNTAYDADITGARNYLVNIQNDETEGLTNSNWQYGGWGYYGNSAGWSDLSNTQWDLMGLDAANLPESSDTWSKAKLYVTRSQNLHATNPTYDSTNDGGFTYQPPTISCCWGNGGNPRQSYGAMTAAGVWGLRLTGVDTSDQKVKGGLNWLKNHYSPIETVRNPGIGGEFLYYYLLSFSKALVMTDIIKGSWQETASNEITNFIVKKQNDNGHWTSYGWEEDDLLATEEAILTLQTRVIPTDIQSLSYLTFILHSNADLHIYDPLGRHVGKNYETGGIDIQIPDATYTSNGEVNVRIPNLESGNYRIVLIGTGNGEYTLDVIGGVGDEIVSEESYTSSISEGETHDATVNVAMLTGLSIHVTTPDPIEAMVQSATGTGQVSFVSDAGNIENLIAFDESDMTEEGKPNIQFPHGLFSFNITGLTEGQTVNVTIAFPSTIPTYAQYWKYSSTEGWYQIPIGSNDGDNIIIIQLQDGGLGDDDGIANGIIIDAGGPGTSIATKLEYLGDLTAQYSDFATLKAQLNDSGNNNPLSGKSISFTLGAQTATAITGTDGIASTTIKLDQIAGSYNVKAEFVGDDYYSSDNDSKSFSITREDTTITYTGDMIVPRTSGSINLRATLEEIDTDYGDLIKIKVNFTIYKSSDLTYSNPIATVPSVVSVSVTSSGTGIGMATATINNLPVDDYMVIARIVPNDYYKPITSTPTPLIVYEPTGQFTTGGGWILDPTGSHGNFGFTAKYNKQGKVQGNSVYVYHQNGFDYIVKSNAWIGLAIKGITSSFQGKASLQIYDPATGLLQPGSSGNFQFTVEAVDNELSKTPDTYKITVLDKNGVVYHTATGQLQGGNIVIHEK
ncbi:MAG: choice-of-anchor U domain-containing protein [Candidatus Methanoperedens sp.]